MPAYDAHAMDPMLRERAKGIRMLALDVDGVMTDGKLYFDREGNELKAFYTRDGLGMKALQRFGFKLAIITGRESPMVQQRASQLGVDFVYQGREDKLTAFHELLAASGLQAEEVCFAGDDWIDLPVMVRCGLAVTVPEADFEVKNRAHWVTTRSGGGGAVREICDLLLTAHGHDQVLLDSLLNP